MAKVDVYVQTRTEPFDALNPTTGVIGGVFVSIHAVGTTGPLGSGTTDAAGSVFLANLDPGDYEIHITPAGPAKVTDGNLQKVSASDTDANGAAVGNNYFDVLIDSTDLPQATDGHLCRCSGTFVDPYGRPLSKVSLHFSENSIPTLVHYSGNNTAHAIVPKSILVETDVSGYTSVDLIQGARYSVYMEGYTNISRTIVVPKLLAAPLPDVLFPFVDSVQYTNTATASLLNTSAPTISVSVGSSVTLDLETVHRSGVRLDGLVDVLLKDINENSDVATVTYSGSSITVTGVSIGNFVIKVERVAPKEGSGVSVLSDAADSVLALLGDLNVSSTA